MDTLVDIRIVTKIQKLLALARDGGATEGEANSAMEMAQRIMLANNLSMATVEAAGEVAQDGKRIKDEARGVNKNRSWAQYPWQRNLMDEIGRVNFVRVSEKWGRSEGGGWKGKVRQTGYTLIGREGNVVAAKEMFTYLMTTINRLLMERNEGDHTQNMSRSSLSWKEGCADRLRERLGERFDAMIAEQQREVREREAAARHPSAAATGTALVVVMKDYAQAEEDANADLVFGYEPGTTARHRAERAATEAAAEAETTERLRVAKGEGATERELSTMRLRRCSLEAARLFIEQIDNPAPDLRTEAEKKKAAEKEAREEARWQRYWDRKRAREFNRLDHGAYREGQRAGDKIGLDKQVTDHKGGKIG